MDLIDDNGHKFALSNKIVQKFPKLESWFHDNKTNCARVKNFSHEEIISSIAWLKNPVPLGLSGPSGPSGPSDPLIGQMIGSKRSMIKNEPVFFEGKIFFPDINKIKSINDTINKKINPKISNQEDLDWLELTETLYTYLDIQIFEDRLQNRSIGEGEDFPWKKRFVFFSTVRKRFEELSNVPPLKKSIVSQKFFIKRMKIPPESLSLLKCFIWNPKGENLVIKEEPENYYKWNNITDYFAEELRIKIKRKEQAESSYEYWFRNGEKIYKSCLEKYDEVNLYTLRETMYKEHFEVSTFKESSIIRFIKEFNPKSILDISAGWGNRLLGAMAMKVRYLGVDPNPDMQPVYKRLIETFSTEGTGRYQVIQSPFETVELPEENFDMVFSSPPFFDLEEYSSKPGQSYHNRNFDQWYEDFLLFSIKKSWKKINRKGYLILYINDTPEYHFTLRMINDINHQCKGVKYLGCLPIITLKPNEKIEGAKSRAQPFWIWQKV